MIVQSIRYQNKEFICKGGVLYNTSTVFGQQHMRIDLHTEYKLCQLYGRQTPAFMNYQKWGYQLISLNQRIEVADVLKLKPV